MNCQEMVELIERYVDFDLTEAEERLLLSHLKDCPECADRLEKLKQLSIKLESLPEVTPPYSIVDSILPKLKEMDLFPEESAALEHTAELKPFVRKLRWNMREWISWKSVVGGIAAGIVLGMFIFKQDGVVLQQHAEDLLSQSRSDKASGGISAGDSASNNQKNGTPQYGQNISNGTENTRKPEASGTPKAPAEPSKTGQSPAIEILMPDIFEPTPNGGLNVGSSDSIKVPSESGKSQDTQTPAPLTSTPGPSSKSTAGQTPAPSAKDAPSTAPNAVESITPTPSPEGYDFKIRTFHVHPAPEKISDSQTLVSPSGVYTAVIKDQTVVVNDKSGNEVFRSPVQRKDDDALRLVSWTDDNKLTYQVKAADGTEASFTIDIAAKAESKN